MHDITQIETLGTHIVIVCDAHDAKERAENAERELRRINDAYSRFIEGNALSDLNAHMGERVRVSDEMYAMLSYALKAHELTDGAFNVVIKSILERMGYDAHYSFVEHAEIAAVAGSLAVHGNNEVTISAPIELGGIGKGYALDRVAALYADAHNVSINAGGDIFVKGIDPTGSPWTVAFEHPLDTSMALGMVQTTGPIFCASSAGNRRAWKNHHHIIDPSKKASAQDMQAVFTQSDTGMAADVYATALFVLGYDRAQAYIERLPVEAMLIGANGAMWRSDGFRGELFTEE